MAKLNQYEKQAELAQVPTRARTPKIPNANSPFPNRRGKKGMTYHFPVDLHHTLKELCLEYDTNVTALMTNDQVGRVTDALSEKVPAIISVFAGRIADTGRDPVPLMAAAVAMCSIHNKQELIWASPRELLNIFQADAVGDDG